MRWPLKIVLIFIAVASLKAQKCDDPTYQKKGCYVENPKGIILFNDRNKINWKNFPEFIKSLACRCERQAKSRGYYYFAIRFYGICVGLNVASDPLGTALKNGNCKNTNYKVCDDFSNTECIGAGKHEYVYLVGQNGGYGEWMDWGSCSVTCGQGFVERRRECDNPIRLGNGKPCTVLGPGTQRSKCARSPCVTAIDGKFGSWSAFSACSKTCGGGQHTRTRKCDSPPPFNGGKYCVGKKTEITSCNDKKCPVKVDGKFGTWSPFTQCNKSCGDGEKRRTRKCNSPAPKNGGRDCQGVTTEVKKCKVKECPVDGGFGQWSSFSACSKSCGGGLRTRTRKCNSPPPSGGGKYCIGTEFEATNCNIDNCKVDGKFGPWSTFSGCSKSCGGGLATRTRKCNNPPPSNGGKYCQGVESETKVCNNKGCPVDGKFGSWSSFGSCSVTCGTGVTYRSRKCNNPTPSNGGKSCTGDKRQTAQCTMASCKVDGRFGQWSSYGACSSTCGGGQQHRRRSCDSPRPANGGRNCQGAEVQSRACANNPCTNVPVNGKYGPWSAFGACSKSCGGGTQFRTRKCNNPPPANGGAYCLGQPMDIRDCNKQSCVNKVDGGFGPWSSFSACSKSCGGGVMQRTRQCNNPPPSHGGRYCQGAEFETVGCNNKGCGVDGGFGQWSSFSACSKSCGGGVMQRTRQCNNPPPSNGGRYCQGKEFETRSCSNNDCGGHTTRPPTVTPGNWRVPYRFCFDKEAGEYPHPDTCVVYISCLGSRGFLRYCPDTLVFDATTGLCDWPWKIGCGGKAIHGGFSEWTAFSSCSQTCGGGVQLRQRDCNNPKPRNGGRNCVGHREETRGCKNQFCEGTDGVTKAQILVENFLKNFHNVTYPGLKPNAKFIRAIFEIQKAIAGEFVSVDPTSKKDLETLLNELRQLLVVATKGGSIDFARVTLGKTLLAFMKKKVKEGLPIDDLTKASEKYLKWIELEVGKDKFTKIISSQGASTLMFVMDTTASMKEEINAAKAIAKSIIDETRTFSVDYILSPFNDPKVGPVIYKTEKQRDEVIRAISDIRIRGGWDCPERAFAGMLAALNKGPEYGSPMFVFTDASAKDDTKDNMAALKAAAESNDASISFFANMNGCKGSGVDSFKEIATHTSGQVFPLKSDRELIKFTQYVKTSLQQDTVLATGGTLHHSKFYSRKRQLFGTTYSHSFVVDDGVQKLIVSVATSNANSAQQVRLMKADGGVVHPTVAISQAVVFEVADSTPSFVGKWRLLFPSTVGDYKYNVQAVSKDPIEFSHSFIYQQNPIKNSPAYSFKDPIKGRKNKMIVRLGGDNIQQTSLKCQLVDVQGNNIFNSFYLSKIGVDLYSAELNPPIQHFRVKCSGLTRGHQMFERVSAGVSSAKSTFMRATYAGNMFTVPLSTGGVVTDVQVQVFNLAGESSISFSVRTSHGSVPRSQKQLNIRKMGFYQFKYHGPRDMSLRGRTDHVTVTAQRADTKEIFSTTFKILLT